MSEHRPSSRSVPEKLNEEEQGHRKEEKGQCEKGNAQDKLPLRHQGIYKRSEQHQAPEQAVQPLERGPRLRHVSARKRIVPADAHVDSRHDNGQHEQARGDCHHLKENIGKDLHRSMVSHPAFWRQTAVLCVARTYGLAA